MSKTKKPEKRTPVLRKPTPAEELASLHPIERLALRLFEFLASLKLAIVLMLWLIAECASGTFIESQVSTPAARFFVYGTQRFVLLLSLLALNILCAALIRFPWKRYQTGFVVTHLGLLTILGGAMWLKLHNIDAQLRVGQGDKSNAIFEPDEEIITVTYHGKGSQNSETIPIDPGPFTWGTKVFGLPWRKDYVEEHALKSGDVLRIKRFYGNCAFEEVYLPSENGPPALRYRLFNERAQMPSRWLTLDQFGMKTESLPGNASLRVWQVGAAAAIDHFVNNVPRKNANSPEGFLAYSEGSVHHLFEVAKLREKPVTIPGTDDTLRVVQQFKNFTFKDGEIVEGAGEFADNPALKLELTSDGKTTVHYAFGYLHELDGAAARLHDIKTFFTYFPDESRAAIEVVIGPDGALAYRSFSSRGFVGSARVELDKPYPAFAGFSFVPEQIVPKARPGYSAIPKAIKRGDDAKSNSRAMIVELQSGSQTRKATLVRGTRSSVSFGDDIILLDYGIAHAELPFEVRLDEFDEPKNPGTQQAAMFTSKVTVFDKPSGKETKDVVITMNFPLYYPATDGKTYILYQSNIDRLEGKPFSTFTVAYHPGQKTMIAGCLTMVFGIFLMFYMGGYFRKKPKRDRTLADPAVADAAMGGIPEDLPVSATEGDYATAGAAADVGE